MTKPKKKSGKWIIWALAILLVLLVAAAAIKARKKPKGEPVETEKVGLYSCILCNTRALLVQIVGSIDLDLSI